jgi:hypothetical protein
MREPKNGRLNLRLGYDDRERMEWLADYYCQSVAEVLRMLAKEKHEMILRSIKIEVGSR